VTTSALGDRMKRHEAARRALLPRRTYTICRVDIRAARSYLRGRAERPFDTTFMADMDAVAEILCEEITGAAFAYTQSDEISVLYTDFRTHTTEPWFGGVEAKQVSISAALATAALNERRPGRAVFDSRVFTVADPAEVAAYFVWRQRDAVRNSVSMAAQAQFSPGQLHGVNAGRMQELLWSERGINWNDYPDGAKRGRTTVRHVGERPIEYLDGRTDETVRTTAVRHWWETSPAPHFTLTAGSWLPSAIPALPAVGGEQP
jgi:tRNA(His) guanylyltransferase